jgi:hypothetical protein
MRVIWILDFGFWILRMRAYRVPRQFSATLPDFGLSPLFA